MAVGYGTPASDTETGTALTYDIDAGSGAGRVLYVGLRIPSNRTLTAITYGGVTMSLVQVTGLSNLLRLYRLVDPAEGTNSFALTTNGAGGDVLRSVGVVATGVDTTDPDDTPVTQEALDTSADQSTNVATQDGDSVLTLCVVNHSSAGGSITSLNSSLIEIDEAVSSVGLAHGEHSSQVSAGWSFTGDAAGGADFWQIAININASGGGGGSGILKQMLLQHGG